VEGNEQNSNNLCVDTILKTNFKLRVTKEFFYRLRAVSLLKNQTF